MAAKRPKSIKRIAVNTGGWDAPGLNAVIRAVTISAINRGWQVFGIKHGYRGLIDTKEIIELSRERVHGITNLGGTILGTANKGDPFHYPVETPKGLVESDVSDQCVKNFKKLEFDALVAIGGDGSLRIAERFIEKGIPIVGVPKTIDNDLSETVITFGFDTAVSTATEAIDKLHSTAMAHDRVFIVELMGRYAGWIALNAGISSAAHVILIPEIPFDLDKVCHFIREREHAGQHYTMVVCAEGAAPKKGKLMTVGEREAGREVRIGGLGQWLEEEIRKKTGKETRHLVLGHLQRGGSPTTFDRLVALRFGAAAVRCLAEGQSNVMVALDPPTVKAVPIKKAIAKMKAVPADCDTMITARSLGICFGD
jgi:6-phosphofructokinase 1